MEDGILRKEIPAQDGGSAKTAERKGVNRRSKPVDFSWARSTGVGQRPNAWGMSERPDLDAWDFFRFAAFSSAGQPRAGNNSWSLRGKLWVYRPLRVSHCLPVLCHYELVYTLKGRVILSAVLCQQKLSPSRWTVRSFPFRVERVVVRNGEYAMPLRTPTILFDVGPHLDAAKF